MALLDVGGNGCYEVSWLNFLYTLEIQIVSLQFCWVVGWGELSHLHDMDVTLVDPLQVKNGKGYRQTWLHPRKSFIYSFAQAEAGQAH